MLIALAAAVLTQAPPYATASGVQVCARSVEGVCGSSASRAACFDPPSWLPAGFSVRPACVSEGEALACGYGCVRESGKVACAQTPRGHCEAPDGVLTCFDPPAVVYAVFGDAVPAPTCLAQGGRVACGYGCVGGSAGVACAKTPFGSCDESGTCFDPAVNLLCAKGQAVPRAECVRPPGGEAACGYGCKQVGRRAACANTPDGRCARGARGLSCTDPPVRRIHSACIEMVMSAARVVTAD